MASASTDYPLRQNLEQLGGELRTRLKSGEPPTNQDILWSLTAIVDLMLAQCAFSQRNERDLKAIQATCVANHPDEKPKGFGMRVRDKVVDITAYAIAGMAVLAVYWLFLQVTQSGIHLPTP